MELWERSVALGRLGGATLTLGGTWQTVFWILVGFGLTMMLAAIVFVSGPLPPGR